MTDLVFTVGFLVAASALAYWLSQDDDEKHEPSTYERLMIAEKN